MPSTGPVLFTQAIPHVGLTSDFSNKAFSLPKGVNATLLSDDGDHRNNKATTLKLPHSEGQVDIVAPRTAEYLAINPRGLIPTLSFNGEIITESTIIAQFLADQFPGRLLPPSDAPRAPLTRAKINFFQEKGDAAAAAVAVAVKEVEPLLQDA
ncbi:hypothetical protein DFJ73DRAFT_914882 [Zopfochytrium polystomum]|nr:hypothetical protein DFJ73DRAFT_914882 [Zopfochytrium polystomum]